MYPHDDLDSRRLVSSFFGLLIQAVTWLVVYICAVTMLLYLGKYVGVLGRISFHLAVAWLAAPFGAIFATSLFCAFESGQRQRAVAETPALAVKLLLGFALFFSLFISNRFFFDLVNQFFDIRIFWLPGAVAIAFLISLAYAAIGGARLVFGMCCAAEISALIAAYVLAILFGCAVDNRYPWIVQTGVLVGWLGLFFLLWDRDAESRQINQIGRANNGESVIPARRL